MARLIRSLQRTLFSSSANSFHRTHFHGVRIHNSSPYIQSPVRVSTSLLHSRPYATEKVNTETPHHISHHQSCLEKPCKETFESFTVEYRPRERLVVLNKKLEDSGHIMKTEASLVSDGFLSPGEFKFVDGQIYDFDMIVYISEEEGSSDVLKFVCSVWAMRPYTLKIHRVYVLSRDNILVSPYKGPRIRDVSLDLETTLKEFLKARQINDKLYSFLNQTLMEKENIRRENWFRTLHSCLAKKH
ncbi:hypothetical protein JRO89_XS03G0247800 [Xanthoceras sorbifolium]|uniref:Uncharacterized protein n=1 Tax=Xanthoceras sorbifolium TaxID=99658 RepID=A0ABQ8IC84_9ROSI|nr:hypothetical protein JRO89_XS03G0247800 [Xanthoceras sorbifolium]